MTFRPRIWYPIAGALSLVNLAAVWFAAIPGEPLHATAHAALALAFGVWARHLRASLHGNQRFEAIEPLAFEVEQLRQELGEAQERLDFTERILTQNRDAHREEPRR